MADAAQRLATPAAGRLAEPGEPADDREGSRSDPHLHCPEPPVWQRAVARRTGRTSGLGPHLAARGASQGNRSKAAWQRTSCVPVSTLGFDPRHNRPRYRPAGRRLELHPGGTRTFSVPQPYTAVVVVRQVTRENPSFPCNADRFRLCIKVGSDHDPDPYDRASLLFRLRDAHDHEAWVDFVSLYEPAVYRLLRRQGLQDADARDVMQELFLAVSRSIDRWDPAKERGSFRGWLRRVARNLVINWLKQPQRRATATGGSDIQAMLDRLPTTLARRRSSSIRSCVAPCFNGRPNKCAGKSSPRPGKRFGKPLSSELLPQTLRTSWECRWVRFGSRNAASWLGCERQWMKWREYHEPTMFVGTAGIGIGRQLAAG